MDLPPLIFTDTDGLSANTDRVGLVLEISRESVESATYGSVMERLLVLTDTAENFNLYRSSMALFFSGYDDDPRELPEIPEVRAFMQKLTEDWPHWLWFVARDIGAITLVMALLCEVRVVRMAGGFTTEFVNKEELFDKLQDLFEKNVPMFMSYGISPAEINACADSAVQELVCI